jgi:hypothetical protein
LPHPLVVGKDKAYHKFLARMVPRENFAIEPTTKKKSTKHLNHWSLNNLRKNQGFIEKCLVSL